MWKHRIVFGKADEIVAKFTLTDIYIKEQKDEKKMHDLRSCSVFLDFVLNVTTVRNLYLCINNCCAKKTSFFFVFSTVLINFLLFWELSLKNVSKKLQKKQGKNKWQKLIF